ARGRDGVLHAPAVRELLEAAHQRRRAQDRLRSSLSRRDRERAARRGRSRAGAVCYARGRAHVNGAVTWSAWLIYGVTFAVAIVVTLLTAPLVIRLATHLGVIDHIDDERRVHEVPTPRVGGLAVFFGFAVALFAVLGFALSSPFALLPSALHG